jgi:hypothetical protein
LIISDLHNGLGEQFQVGRGLIWYVVFLSVYFIPLLCPPSDKAAGWLAGELSREGHQVALLSGEMQVEQRAAVIDRFREGKEKVLVTTNVCARGYSTNHTNGSFECILLN